MAPYSYGWTFGDLAGGHSSQADPTYVYTSVGTVTDLEGDQATASVVVPVAYAGLTVSVAANVTFGQTPLWVHLVGTATGGTAPYTYDWAFGDATPDSTLPTVDHNYSAAGAYSTRLSVTDSTGTVRNSTVSIDVEPDVDIVVVGAPLSGAAPLVVNFTSNVTGGTAPYAYQWTFGNGNTSSLPNPSVTFGQAGSCTVMLTVTDALTVSESAQLVITVSDGNGTGPHAPVAGGERPSATAVAIPNLSLSTVRDATGPEFLLVPTRRSDRVVDGTRVP